MEVHSIDARDQCHGHEDCSNQSQKLHHLIQTSADRRQVDVQQTGKHIPEGFDCIHYMNAVIVDVPEKHGKIFIDQCRMLTVQKNQCLS